MSVYDLTNLILYTDSIAGTPAPFTPEAANYLLGKGVYPKVAADPLTEYVTDLFKVHPTALDQTEVTAAYNEYLLGAYTIMTDANGDYLVDNDGNYIIEEEV